MKQLACNKPGKTSRYASPLYLLTTMRLSASVSVSDQVLKYFDAYVEASHPNVADPVLITLNYE